MTIYHMHLVSDATGETVSSVARACLVQFKGVEPIEHSWTLIRTKGQIEKVVAAIEKISICARFWSRAAATLPYLVYRSWTR